MSVRDLIAIIRRRWLFVVCGFVIGLLALLAVTATTPVRYTSTATVFVSAGSGSSVADLSTGTSFSQQAAKSYATLASSGYVAVRVKAKLGLVDSSESISQSISATVPLDESVINISVVRPSPTGAAEIANAVAEELGSAVADVSGGRTETSNSVKVTTIEQALPALKPTSPKVAQDIFVGAAGGALLGLLVALLVDALDNRVRSAEALARIANVPILGVVHRYRKSRANDLVTASEPSGAEAESYRTLRANMRYVQPSESAFSVVVTSATAGEGKTATASNLAIAYAAAGRRVVLIDADLRRPRVGSLFGIESEIGLSEVLVGEVSVQEALQHWGDFGLSLLSSGAIPPNPSELLQSNAMGALLERFSGEFDIIIIDAPPILAVADAAVVGEQATGVLLVTSAESARQQQVRASEVALRSTNVRILGAVLTQVRSTVFYGSPYAYETYLSSNTAKR